MAIKQKKTENLAKAPITCPTSLRILISRQEMEISISRPLFGRINSGGRRAGIKPALHARRKSVNKELELEPIQSHMAQKPMLRGEVGARVRVIRTCGKKRERRYGRARWCKKTFGSAGGLQASHACRGAILLPRDAAETRGTIVVAIAVVVRGRRCQAAGRRRERRWESSHGFCGFHGSRKGHVHVERVTSVGN